MQISSIEGSFHNTDLKCWSKNSDLDRFYDLNCNNRKIPRRSRKLQIMIQPIFLRFGENLHL